MSSISLTRTKQLAIAALCVVACTAAALFAAPQGALAASGDETPLKGTAVSVEKGLRWIDFISPQEDAAVYEIAPSGDTSGATDRQALNNVMGKVTTYGQNWNHQDQPITVKLQSGGTYYIDGTIKLFNNVTVEAEGATVNQVTEGKPIFINAYYKDSPVNTGDKKKLKGYNRCKNVTVNGGTYITTGKPAKDAAKGKYGNYKAGYSDFLFMHAQNVHISNVTIKNSYNGHFIEFAGVKDSTIDNVTLTGSYKGDSTNEAIQLDTNANAAVSPQGAPWDGTPCKNITITNSTINVPKMPVGIGTNYDCKKKSSKIKITGNTIKVKKYAVSLAKCKNITVTNNKFLKGKLFKDTGVSKLKASKNTKK